MTACILTTKDFTILEVMLERCPDKQTALARLLRRKTDTARVVFRDDVPETVATLNSRVTFRVSEAEPETRILSQASMSTPTGHFQPITTLRGLALLGLAQGQSITVISDEETEETIEMLQVAHQPETAQRTLLAGAAAMPRAKPVLRLVSGGQPQRPAFANFGGYDDDPGPSAA